MSIQAALVHPASGLNLASPHGSDLAARPDLYRRFADHVAVNPAFTRRVASYQDNKETPGLRRFRFKESFSIRLVRRLLADLEAGHMLDPFAGIGTLH
ncbi:MAG: hypothetical protein OXC13_18135 [Caldilineaceae bacterium]|nr:hypothetical protein [Caldilineaceae bacterium]